MSCIALKTRVGKARKRHVCSWCGHAIEKGETYRNETLSDEDGGVPYTWKSHLMCQELADFLHDFIDPYDGYTQDAFLSGANDFADTFFCPFHCEQWDKECGCCKKDINVGDSRECLRKLHEYSKTRVLYLDTSSKYPTNWCWRVKKIEDKEKKGGDND